MANCKDDGTKSESGRILRLFRLIQDIRSNPVQSLENVLKTHGISRSQFYKDRELLIKMGFTLEYRKGFGFQILEDRLMPITDFSLSDRITLLFALEYLSASDDGLLAAKEMEIGRKLTGGLKSPFREQIIQCFDNEVTQKAYGGKPEVFMALMDAIRERRRIKMLYLRSQNWTESWRIVDPRRLYMRQRTLYLYARTVDETPPAWKVFHLNRIQQIQPTGTTFPFSVNEDDRFFDKQKNAFFAFLGDEPNPVTIRFTGEAIPFVKERRWHESQKLEDQPDGSVLFTVSLAEPMEVIRWAKQFGNDASVVENGNDENGT